MFVWIKLTEILSFGIQKKFRKQPQRSSESHFNVEDSNLNVYFNNNDCYGDKKTHPLCTKLGNLDSDPTGFNLPAFSVKKDFSHLLQRTRYSRTLKCERLTEQYAFRMVMWPGW